MSGAVDEQRWDEYCTRYQVFARSLTESELVALVASKALRNFPMSLPSEWKPSIVNAFRALGNSILAATQRAEGQGKPRLAGSSKRQRTRTRTRATSGRVTVAKPRSNEHDDLVVPSLMLMMSAHHMGDAQFDMSTVAVAQQLTMSFAHISAFVADSIRVICYARPSVLKNDRKVEWRSVIEAGNWDALLATLIDDYVFAFGWDSIQKNVLKMRERFGVGATVSPEALDRIEEAELLRNVVIHDGGRASAEYIKRSGRTDVTVGQQLVVDPALVRKLAWDLLGLGGEIFLDVAEKHLGKDRRTVEGIWRVGKPPDESTIATIEVRERRHGR